LAFFEQAEAATRGRIDGAAQRLHEIMHPVEGERKPEEAHSSANRTPPGKR
jgi:hypothetical protein